MPQVRKNYYIIHPVINMRALPDQSSEIVSQIFFSESFIPLEENAAWIKIETITDHYIGWIKKEGFCERKHPFLQNKCPYATVDRLTAHLYSQMETVKGPLMTLPFESRLEVVESKLDGDNRWLEVALPDGCRHFIQRGDVNLNHSFLSLKAMCQLSKRFIGLPYTWGGRSSFGYDCSGFVQMLYRKMGIFLPRDSQDQCDWEGFFEIPLNDLKLGDLIFFGHEKNKIRHVGLSLGNHRFIHTSAAVENAPYCRISTLKDSAWNESGYYPYRTARTMKTALI